MKQLTVLSLVTVLILAAGCAKKTDAGIPPATKTLEEPAPASAPVAGEFEAKKEKGAGGVSDAATPAAPGGKPSETPVTRATELPGLSPPEADAADIAGELKLIKTATVKCEVTDVDRGFEDVTRIVKAERGIVVGTSRATAEEGYAYGTITLKVVPARYDETIKALRKVGRLLEENSSTEDVTAEYVDLQARLANSEVTRDRLLEILKTKSASVPDILEVEREISRVTEEIERLKGQMRYLDNQVGLSTITVQLEEPHATLPGGYSFGKALREALRIAIRIAIFIIQAFIVLLPFIILLAILLLLIRFIIWMFQRRRLKAKTAAAA